MYGGQFQKVSLTPHYMFDGGTSKQMNILIIYLLNNDMDEVHSIEQIHLDQSLKLRHFVTNYKNELYEDNEGNIYVSADYNGIYKVNFINFR